MDVRLDESRNNVETSIVEDSCGCNDDERSVNKLVICTAVDQLTSETTGQRHLRDLRGNACDAKVKRPHQRQHRGMRSTPDSKGAVFSLLRKRSYGEELHRATKV